MLCAPEAGVAGDVERARGTAAGLALEDDVGVAWQFVQTIRQFAERDAGRACDVALLPLVPPAGGDGHSATDLLRLVQLARLAQRVLD